MASRDRRHGGAAIVARRGLQRAEDARGVQFLGDQQLRGAEALQLQRQRQQRHLRRRELRRRDVGVGQPREVPLQRHGRDEVVGPLVQQAGLDDRPRRDDAHDVALDEPGAGRGVADLLADGHLVAAPDEPRQVALQRVRGHAGHGHALSLAHVAARQHDVELRRRRARVLVEGLVEVAEPEEDDGVGVARLHLEVLPAQGGYGGRSGTVAVDGAVTGLLLADLACSTSHKKQRRPVEESESIIPRHDRAGSTRARLSFRQKPESDCVKCPGGVRSAGCRVLTADRRPSRAPAGRCGPRP